MYQTNHNENIPVYSFEGHVTSTNEKLQTFDMLSFMNKAVRNCCIPTGVGYTLPKVGDVVMVIIIQETGKPIFMGMSPQYNRDDGEDEGIPEKKDKELRRLSSNEVTPDILGPDPVGGTASQDKYSRRRDIQAGDKIIFDTFNSYMVATAGGDLMTVISDVLKEFYVKKEDLKRTIFRRRRVEWPGGELKMGDFKIDSDTQKEEDIDLAFYTTTQNDKKTYWRAQFGSNIEDKETNDKNIIGQIEKFSPVSEASLGRQMVRRYRETHKKDGSVKKVFYTKDEDERLIIDINEESKEVIIKLPNGLGVPTITFSTTSGNLSIDAPDSDISINCNSFTVNGQVMNISAPDITIDGQGDGGLKLL